MQRLPEGQKGGQHVSRSFFGILITHEPTGICVGRYGHSPTQTHRWCMRELTRLVAEHRTTEGVEP